MRGKKATRVPYITMSFAKEYSKYAVHAADSGSNSKAAEGVNRDGFAFVP
jgi:hypothetical protein